MHLFKISILFYALLSATACRNRTDSRPWLFQATYDFGVGGCSLAFRADSTCEWLGGQTSNDREGTYKIRDSIIILEKLPLETCLKSNYLVMTDKNPHEDKRGNMILLQVDKQGNIVDSHFIFTIHRKGVPIKRELLKKFMSGPGN